MKRKLVMVIIVLFFIAIGKVYSEEVEGFKSYFVKKGDFLSRIAPREHWDLIQRVNKIDEKNLFPDKRILIVEDLEKAKNFCPVPKNCPQMSYYKALYFFLNIQYFGAYYNGNLQFWGPISSGRKKYETPVGTFRVLWKKKDYISKKYNTPMPYAVCFSDQGYFFHHQSLPGKPASHGCIRLLKSDAKKLFDWVQKNDLIVIIK